MNKNRRITHHIPLYNLYINQNKPTDKWTYNNDEKQNQAKLVLLDMENDDSMFQVQSILCDQTNGRNSLLGRMKAHQTQQINKNISKNIFSSHQLNILLPIDNNTNFQINNFIDDKPPQSSAKKQRFSLRNIPSIKSKENIHPPSKAVDNKKQDKTILNLKKILKKLQSPQKNRNSIDKGQYQIVESIIKRQKSSNKITEYCSQFLCKQFSSKQKTLNQFGSHQKQLQNQNQQNVKFYEFRSISRTSHQRRKSSLGRSSKTSSNTPKTFFYKPAKLTNKNMLLKRNSVTTGDLMKQSKLIIGHKKPSGRIMHQTSKNSLQVNQFDEIYLHQQKIKQDRKNRNLKNILFD